MSCGVGALHWAFAIALIVALAAALSRDRAGTAAANQQGAAILHLQTTANCQLGRSHYPLRLTRVSVNFAFN